MNKTESVQSLDNEPSRKSLVKNTFDKAFDRARDSVEKYILKITAVSAIGATALTGCATSSEATPEPTKQVEVQKTKQEIKQEEEEAEKQKFLQEELEASIEAYNLPKPEGWDEVDALSLDEFKLLPIETRVDYAAYLNRDNKIEAQRWFMITGNEQDLTPINTVPSTDNTIEEINAFTRDITRAAVISHFGRIEDAEKYSDTQRQKIATSLYENPDTAPAQAWRDAAVDPDFAGYPSSFYAIDNVMLADETYSEISPIHKIVDRQGVERDAISYVMTESDGKAFAAKVMLVHTDYTSAWVSITN